MDVCDDCEYQGTKYYVNRVKTIFVPAMPNCKPRSQNQGVLCGSNHLSQMLGSKWVFAPFSQTF